MQVQLKRCPKENVFARLKEIIARREDEYLEEIVLKRSSSLFIEFYHKGTWIGFALLESLKHLSIGSLLDDIIEEEEFEKAYSYIEKHLKESGYYLHIFRIFEEYQHKGLGTQAERTLMLELNSPILLYSVSESLSFWEKVGYESLDGEYYYIKELHSSQELVG